MPPKSKKEVTKATKSLPGEQEFNQAQLFEFVLQDYKVASRCYEKACSVGHALAQYNYGQWFLEDGRRNGAVKPDDVRGRKLIQSAAQKNVGIAQLALAQMYEAGKAGLVKNEVKAFELYKKALENPATLSLNQQEQTRLKLFFLHFKVKMDTMKNSDSVLTEDDSFTSSQLFGTIKDLILAPGNIHRQKEADRKWNVMCDYLGKLPEEEKPNTFNAWEKVMTKCGYQVQNRHEISNEKITDDRPCSFQDFMTLTGGSFTNMDSYELQDYPEPKRKCGNCNKEEGEDLKLKLCARCAQPYCSKICQKKDWSLHKPVCNAVYHA